MFISFENALSHFEIQYQFVSIMLTECLVKYLQNKCGCLNRARGNK